MTDDLAPANEWDAYAADWDSDVAARAYAAAALASLQTVLARTASIRAGLDGVDVIDFGAGTGLLTERLVDAGSRVHAVDTSTAMLEEIRTKIETRSWTNVTVGAEPPPIGAPFDLVVCSSVCAFVDDYPSTVAELADRLRPGGLFVQWDWERTSDDDTHGLTRTEIATALESAGLTEVCVDEAFEVHVGDQTMRPLIGHGRKP